MASFFRQFELQGGSSRPRFRWGWAGVLALSGLLSGNGSHAAVLYVKPTGNDGQPGTSWVQAKSTVGAAMAVAQPLDQIWVAAGTYTERVSLKPDVGLYGGFAGTETALNQRNYNANHSILNGNSVGTTLSFTNCGANTRVDGMWITGGYGINGGGISCVGSGPVIANNVVYYNVSNAGVGAGLFILGGYTLDGAQPQVLNNLIYGNTTRGLSASLSFGDGGGIAVGNSSPVITGNVIVGNQAARNAGGIGLWTDCQATIANNVIEANAASASTQIIGYGGGIYATANDFDDWPQPNAVSAPTIVNNLIVANGAESGGGVALGDSILGAATLVNNTIVANIGSGLFWGNTAPTNYNNIIAFNSTGLERLGSSLLTFRNNDVFGNSVLGNNTDYVNYPNATGLNGNLSADPVFANFAIGNLRIQPNSPCVNAGLNAAVVPDWPDLIGNPRIAGGVVDLGAYESTGATLDVPTPVIYVRPGGNDANNGQSWAAAKQTVQAGINAAVPNLISGGQVWVAQGTYREHISLPAWVALYGGFFGTETTLGARNITAYRTVLDGGGTPTVVKSQAAGYLVCRLDGFTVQNGGVYTAGQSPTSLWPDGLGGGIACSVSAPIIANNLISSNSVGNPYNSNDSARGGGVFLYLGPAQLSGNTFSRNDVLDRLAGAGGGLYCLRSKPTVTGNLFTQNHAPYGSAIYATACAVNLSANSFITNYMYSTLPNDPLYQGAFEGTVYLTGATHDFVVAGNLFQGNWAHRGAGLDVAGAFVGTVRNNLFLYNLAYDQTSGAGMGGGVYFEPNGQTQPGDTALLNNTLVGNNAPGPFAGTDLGGGVALNAMSSAVTVANNIIAFNSGGIFLVPGSVMPATYGHNCVTNPVNYSGIGAGTGDLLLDPRFVNRAAGDFHLLGTSPCVDSGLALAVAPTDKDGVLRPLDGNNDGLAAWDLGAYEYVNAAADTDHDGVPDAGELTAGTNPTDPNSLLRLQIQPVGGGSSVKLGWLSVTGRTYSVQFKPRLTGAWQSLISNIAGTGPIYLGTLLQIQDAPGTNRFYRLAVSSSP